MEFCELAGTKPDPNDMPVNPVNLDNMMILATEIHSALPDTYIPGGMDMPIYNGKDLSGLLNILELFEVDTPEERRTMLKAVTAIDRVLVRDAVKKATDRAKKRPSK